MPRKRMIDPNIWESEDFSRLTPFSRLVFIGLFSLADDEGRGRAKPSYIKSKLFPYDDMRVADIDKALSEIGPNMSVTIYRTHDGNEFYSLDHWRKWQRVEKPSESVIPRFDGTCTAIHGSAAENSATIPGTFPECSGNDRGAVAPKRIEKKEILSAFFDSVWKLYPNKRGKGQVSDSQKMKLQQIGLEQLERCIERYLADLKRDEWRKPQNGSTFFNSGYVDYLDENYQPPEPEDDDQWEDLH